MRRSMGLVCLTFLFASMVGTAACTEAGGGRRVAADAGDAGEAEADDDGKTPVTPSASAGGCEAIAQARCGKADECTAGVAIKTRDGSLAACVARVAAECTEASAPVSFDSTTSKSCVTAIEAQSCAALAAGVRLSECSLHGSRLEGAPCGHDEQCESGYCPKVTGSTCGQCAPVLEAGHACKTSADCGNRGDLSCVRSICTPFEEKGQECGDEDVCAPGLVCATPDGGAFASCVDAATIDQPCAPAGAVTSSCVTGAGLYCSSAGRCTRTNVARTGQRCGMLVMGWTDCNVGAFCLRGAGSATGTCVLPLAEGAECDPNAGASCVAESVCVADTADSGAAHCSAVNHARCF